MEKKTLKRCTRNSSNATMNANTQKGKGEWKKYTKSGKG